MEDNQEEVLAYTSTAPMFDAVDDVPTEIIQDEVDEGALLRVQEALNATEEYYKSIDSLASDPDMGLSVEQRLEINSKMLFHVRELSKIVSSAVNNVKEARNARR